VLGTFDSATARDNLTIAVQVQPAVAHWVMIAASQKEKAKRQPQQPPLMKYTGTAGCRRQKGRISQAVWVKTGKLVKSGLQFR
jgi:hypothetical protein